MLFDRRPNGNLAETHPERLGERLGIRLGAHRGAEARHRRGRDAIARKPERIEGAHGHEQRERRGGLADDADRIARNAEVRDAEKRQHEHEQTGEKRRGLQGSEHCAQPARRRGGATGRQRTGTVVPLVCTLGKERWADAEHGNIRRDERDGNVEQGLVPKNRRDDRQPNESAVSKSDGEPV